VSDITCSFRSASIYFYPLSMAQATQSIASDLHAAMVATKQERLEISPERLYGSVNPVVVERPFEPVKTEM
jgi:hypothetical protein